MRISITNYRNINELGITIEEDKVNYLFGVCGSGKSSILDAISKPVEAKDATAGREDKETVVLVDGKQPASDAATVYSIDRQSILFGADANEDCYRVFIGDESELKSHEAAFHDSIESLREIKGMLLEMRSDIDSLAKEIGKPAARSGKFAGSSKLCKAHGVLTAATGRARKAIDANEYAVLEWRSSGFTIDDAFDRRVCPFCGQGIPEALTAELSELRDLTVKELKPIFTSTTLMGKLGFKEPDYLDEAAFTRLKERLEQLFIARTQMDIVIQYCNIGSGTALLNGVPKGIEINEALYEFVPDLRRLIEDVSNRRNELTKLLGQMAADLKKMVGANARNLNSKLRMLGIPYVFELGTADREGCKAAYILRHIDRKLGEDMRDHLSYGEKNLVALLLFLHNNLSELTLIDDPASSYDEFRRSQIYRCIMEHKGGTVLVVSHDQAFVRRAVCDENSDKLGSVLFLENAGRGCRTFPITRSSFVFIDDEIRKRIQTTEDYYQIMVNVRLYCDIHRHEISEAAWGYTSAVLHGKEPQEIATLLEAQGTDEQTVVVELRRLFGDKVCTMPASVDRSAKETFSDYEALIVAREHLSLEKTDANFSTEKALQLNMLNDLVHMNDCALFCLNPYAYAVWPPVFAGLLEEHLTA